MNPKQTLPAAAFWAIILLVGLSQAALGEEQVYRAEGYGFSLGLLKGMGVFTPENPGPFPFKTDTLFFLVHRSLPGSFILANLFAASSENVLKDVRSSLESGDLPQPGYRKVAVRSLLTGKNQNRPAVEHLFHLDGPVARTLRQVFFVVQGRGVCFTCNAKADGFEAANREFFEPVLRSLTFE